MLVCTTCGQENRDGFKFCGGCGNPLVREAPPEVRKVVTVLFCDLTGSTALGDRLDAERLRAVLRDYHARLREIIERHGGTVEKFIGDAVMGVFGLPQIHEDDALRAVRAADEMRAAVGELELQVRIGVNTGEVVAGAGETLVTGDAVNVAARLEQAAADGEILIGETTHELVAVSVRAEPVDPFRVKGKLEPVAAFRVVDVRADVPAFTRRIDAPFVGREEELAALAASFARARETRTCQLCTIVGPPGIGKSRLARETIATAGSDAHVVVGRCLSYGDGITYWPLAEIVRQVVGPDPRRLAELVPGDDGQLVADRIATVMGIANGATLPEEIFWAFRKLFEALAHEQALIVVVDDIHWAEPTLLDLLEYVATFATGAPILLLCLARPDLFDLRPTWSNPRPNAVVLPLEPLPQDEALRLVDRVLAERVLSEDARSRVIAAAEGNPLFVEQLLAMQSDVGDGELELPATIQALLAARIDRLPAEERAVVERAAIEGRMFHRGAVATMLPGEARASIGTHLISLVRKEFIRPDRSLFVGDDGFRFSHVLIRDAAYAAVSKHLRAQLHERFATWLDNQAGERASEYDEIVAYHLEQAVRYKMELDLADGRLDQLVRQAADRLAEAGRRAFARGDAGSAVSLLRRATTLPDQDQRADLLLNLGAALNEAGGFAEAERVLTSASAIAGREGNDRIVWRAQLEHSDIRLSTRPAVAPEVLAAQIHESITFLADVGDDSGLAHAWSLLALIESMGGRAERSFEAAQRAIDHAHRAGDEPKLAQAIGNANAAMFLGPIRVGDALERANELLATFGKNRTIEGTALSTLCLFLAMAGRFDDARETACKAKANAEELGQRMRLAIRLSNSAMVELWAGNFQEAEQELRHAWDVVNAMGADLAPIGVDLANVLHAFGRDDEALALLDTYPVSQWEIVSAVLWRSTRAKVLARLERLPEAIELSLSARERVSRTDFLSIRADVLLDAAEVLCLADRTTDATSLLEEALALHRLKGNIAGEARGQTALEKVLAPTPDA